MIEKTSYRLLLCGCAVLVLGACGLEDKLERRGGTPAEPGSAEDLLAAEGSWNIVEEDAASADPTSLHRMARKRVDPTSMKKKTYVPQSALVTADASAGADGEDVNYRLLRVERDVASLSRDFKKLLPPLSRLIVADQELDQTIQSIQTAEASSGAAVPPSKPKPRTMADIVAAQKKPEPPAHTASAAAAAPPVPAAPGERAVKAVRFGDHPGRTRIVLDVTGPATFKSDVDNAENLLMLELPGTSWSADMSKALKHPLIAGYSAQPSAGGGTVLAIEMKKPVKVLGGSSLPPNATYNNHRVFVDVAAL